MFSRGIANILVLHEMGLNLYLCFDKLICVISCAGFVKLKMQNKLGAPVAFVDFKDANSSTEALNRLQGVVLYSSPGEGIRLEYAKSRMGLRKRDKRP